MPVIALGHRQPPPVLLGSPSSPLLLGHWKALPYRFPGRPCLPQREWKGPCLVHLSASSLWLSLSPCYQPLADELLHKGIYRNNHSQQVLGLGQQHRSCQASS